MRRNFAQILAEASINVPREYDKLTDILYCNRYDTYQGAHTLYEMMDSAFDQIHFRGTCLSLAEFDEQNHFDFPDEIDSNEVDILVSFCEYLYNLVQEFWHNHGLLGYGANINYTLILEQIDLVMESIGFMKSYLNNLVIYVELSASAVAVAESPLVPQDLSYKLISYNHHSMKGDLRSKKSTIRQLADLLEPRRPELQNIDKSFTKDLFYLFNNLNIRHNNVEAGSNNYNRAVAELPSDQLEEWYDETYQMCLLAFMRLEQTERKPRFDELKAEIEQSK